MGRGRAVTPLKPGSPEQLEGCLRPGQGRSPWGLGGLLSAQGEVLVSLGGTEPAPGPSKPAQVMVLEDPSFVRSNLCGFLFTTFNLAILRMALTH